LNYAKFTYINKVVYITDLKEKHNILLQYNSNTTILPTILGVKFDCFPNYSTEHIKWMSIFALQYVETYDIQMIKDAKLYIIEKLDLSYK